MTKFKVKKFSNDNNVIAIIDVGSYKIRVAICEFLNGSINLLGFSEKRQSTFDVINNHIKNLEGICENINLAIKKAEKKARIKVNKIAINPFFGDSFSYANKLNFKRDKEYKLINKKEISEIVENLENIHYKSSIKKIYENFLYPESDLNIIVSNISEIKIDGKKQQILFQNSGKVVTLNILNVFLSKNNIELLNYVSRYIKKDLVKILPQEFCLSKIWEKKKEVVIINIGNSSSYITIKDKSSNIFGTIKIGVGIENLIEKIIKNSGLQRAEIIKKIDREDLFKQEKKEFLQIYVYLIEKALEEIMGDNTIPNNFFIIGGGGNNQFFKNYIEKYNFSKNLKINNKIKFTIPNVSKIGKIDNVEEILNKSNLNLIAMILTMGEINKHKQDFIEQTLEDTIKEIKK